MNPNNTAFVYLFFNQKPQELPDAAPIMHSIACLKSHQDYKVYVLDCSDHINDWSTWEQYLGFSTISIKSQMENQEIRNLLYSYKTKTHLKMISKPWDIYHHTLSLPEQYIVHCDTDLFWIKDPMPFDGNPDKLCCCWNTGMFYFNKHSSKVKQCLEIWKAFISLAVVDPEFHSKLKTTINDYNSLHLQEEIVFRYIQKIVVDLGLSEQTSDRENYSIKLTDCKLKPYHTVAQPVKALHIRNNNKRESCQAIEEINRRIQMKDPQNLLVNTNATMKIKSLLNPIKI